MCTEVAKCIGDSPSDRPHREGLDRRWQRKRGTQSPVEPGVQELRGVWGFPWLLMQWEQGHGDRKAGAPRGCQGREAALRQEGRGQSRKCPFRPCEQGSPLPPNEV